MDAKIDAYVKENPKYWSYVQAMPRERLERTVVLNEVRELRQVIGGFPFHTGAVSD